MDGAFPAIRSLATCCAAPPRPPAPPPHMLLLTPSHAPSPPSEAPGHESGSPGPSLLRAPPPWPPPVSSVSCALCAEVRRGIRLPCAGIHRREPPHRAGLVARSGVRGEEEEAAEEEATACEEASTAPWGSHLGGAL